MQERSASNTYDKKGEKECPERLHTANGFLFFGIYVTFSSCLLVTSAATSRLYLGDVNVSIARVLDKSSKKNSYDFLVL